MALKASVIAAYLAFGSAAQAQLTFDFDFSGNTPGVGFLDPTFGAARQQALFTSASLFSNLYGTHFAGTAVLTFDVASSFAPGPGTLASAGSNEVAATGFGNGDVIRTKIQTGTDLNGMAKDGTVTVNWGQNWELNPNTPAVANGPNASFDFYAAMNHEFTHALGFGSNINAAGDTPGSYSKWDQFLTNKAGVPIVDPNTMLVNGGAYSDAQANGGLFAGVHAVAAYGGPVPLVVDPDISHLNTDAFSPPTVSGPFMMVPFRSEGPQEARAWSSVEVGILKDLGYAQAVPEPSTYLMMLTGIAGLCSVRRRMAA